MLKFSRKTGTVFAITAIKIENEQPQVWGYQLSFDEKLVPWYGGFCLFQEVGQNKSPPFPGVGGDIDSCINKITNWLNTNILSINNLKTKFMLFRSCKKKQQHNISISINNELISQVKNTTFLGVVLDECFNMEGSY